jgi:hypothetical protein
VYNCTDRCHRAENRQQLINIISYHNIIHVSAIYRFSEGDVSTKGCVIPVHRCVRQDVTIYRYNNMNGIAVMVLKYSWLKFSDKPKFTTCVLLCRYRQTCNVDIFGPVGSAACQCGHSLQLAQCHSLEATQTHKDEH